MGNGVLSSSKLALERTHALRRTPLQSAALVARVFTERSIRNKNVTSQTDRVFTLGYSKDTTR